MNSDRDEQSSKTGTMKAHFEYKWLRQNKTQKTSKTNT